MWEYDGWEYVIFLDWLVVFSQSSEKYEFVNWDDDDSQDMGK